MSNRIEKIVNDYGDLEIGEHLKHSYCVAEKVLDVDQKLLDGMNSEDAGFIAPFIGKRLSIDGTQDYNYGWERGYEPVKISVKVTKTIQVTEWETVGTIDHVC